MFRFTSISINLFFIYLSTFNKLSLLFLSPLFAKRILPNSSEVLWASTREIFNIVDAINSRADIITISSDYLAKLKYKNYDLDKFSKLTCKQFFQDGKKLKY